MKNFITLLSVAALCLSAASGCKNVVVFDSLPAGAKTFLTGNFPDSPVSYAVKEFNEYEVILADGTEITFDGDGEWTSVEMNRTAVPDGVMAMLPASVSSYLSTSFANVPVEKVERGFSPAYKVELLNGLELEFNSEGVCRSIDD